MDNLLSIGKMAKQGGVSVPALRLYDKMGLFSPSYTDSETGYRYYDIRQNAKLDMIRYMKELGMSLKEIGSAFEREDLDLIRDVLSKRHSQCEAEIEHIRLQQSAITRLIASIDRFQKSPPSGTKTLEYIPERRIYAIPASVNFYGKDIGVYEKLLGELKTNILENELPQFYYCTVGTTVKKEDISEGKLIADEIFIFVDEKFPMPEKTKLIPGGSYACIYLDKFDDEPEFAARLLEYCREEGYSVAGDYICEVLTELNILNSRERSMFLRLQIPISFKKA